VVQWGYYDFGVIGSQRIYSSLPYGLWSETYFDGLGRVIKERTSGPDSKTIVAEQRYDRRGAVSFASLPLFEGGGETTKWWEYRYDPLGRILEAINPDATKSLSCYLNSGVSVQIDENGHRKRYSSDVFGRLVKVEEYKGAFATCSTSSEANYLYATTTYDYDVLGNLRYVTDTKGNQTEMRYDTLGRKRYMRDPDMGEWSYTYDDNGNLESQTDALSQTIRFKFDALNRIKLKDYPTGTDVSYVYDEAFSTYAKGRLTTMADESGTTKYYYDRVGLPNQTIKTVDGVSYTVKTNYDLLGMLGDITYPDNEKVSYSYNAGNLSSVYNSAGSYATITGYDPIGQAGTITFGNGVTTTYQYHPTHKRLNSILTSSPTQGSLINLSYDYYNNGLIKTVTDALNTAIPHNISSDGYTPATGKPHAVGSTDSGRTFMYNNNGNLTSDGKRTYEYTYENMPRSISGTVGFVYDGNAQRVKKTVSGQSRVYIDKLYECSNVQCGKYIFAGGTRIALKEGTTLLYYHPDHQGSTVAVTDGNGTTTGGTGSRAEATAYYPFGEIRSDTGQATVTHKFTGQELDYETGLYNYNARLYDPELGRFVSADPIVGDPTNPQNLNRYSYALNDPVNLVDPSGNTSIDLNNNTNGRSNSNNNTDSPDSDSIDGEKLGHEIERAASNVGHAFERFGQNFRDFFSGGDSPPPPPYPNSTRFNNNSYLGFFKGLDNGIANSNIKLPLINNFVDLPQGDDASMALNFTPVGVAGTVGSRLTSSIVKAERHHLLSRQFKDFFDLAQIKNINDSRFMRTLDMELHKVIHGKGGGETYLNSWNMQWKNYFQESRNRSWRDIYCDFSRPFPHYLT